MSHYEDEAQVEQLRRWWRENWQALAAGLVLGLGGIFGWQAWTNAKNRAAEHGSQIYEDLKRSLDSKPDQAAAQAETLVKDYGSTPYAAQGELLMAQYAAGKGDWAKAHEHLDWVVEHARDEGLVKIAKLRLARVMWQENKPADALAQLDIGDQDSFAPLYLELRGDIVLAQGDKSAARAAYEKALQLGPAAAAREGIQRKLDDLAEAKS